MFHDAVAYAPEFYHGLSSQMTFPSFMHYFRGPTSTSLRLDVAVSFANQGADDNGTVIALKNTDSINTFFDCIYWSRFSAESEMLFIGGFQPLYICGLRLVGAALNFDRWIPALVALNACLQGDAITDKVSDEDAETARALVTDALGGGVENLRIVPVYISRLFRNLLDSTTAVAMDKGCFSKECMFTVPHGDRTFSQFGLKIISDIFLTETGRIKWSVLRRLLPNLKMVAIRNSKFIPKKESVDMSLVMKMVESVKIDEALLDGILRELRFGAAWTNITIFNPTNSAESLWRLICKYMARFKAEKFQINTDIYKDDVHGVDGSHIVFTIRAYA